MGRRYLAHGPDDAGRVDAALRAIAVRDPVQDVGFALAVADLAVDRQRRRVAGLAVVADPERTIRPARPVFFMNNPSQPQV